MKPYLSIKNGQVKDWNIQQGVNFAVAGATALDDVFFEEKGFDVEVATYYSLRVQLDWFKEFLPSLCNSSSSMFPTFPFPASLNLFMRSIFLLISCILFFFN